MGLAASQCRLLFITSRQNDVSAKMQRISNDRLTLSRDEDDLATEYNRRLNATKYVNTDGSDISYNAIMNSSAGINGQYNVIQNAGREVVLNQALANKFGLTAASGTGDNFKQIHPDTESLIRTAEGVNADDIIAKLNEVPETPDVTETPTQTNVLTDAMKTQMNEFKGMYGSYPTKEKNVTFNWLINQMGSLSGNGCDNSDMDSDVTGRCDGSIGGLNMSYYDILNGDHDIVVEIADDGDTSGVPWTQLSNNLNNITSKILSSVATALGIEAGPLQTAAKEWIKEMWTGIKDDQNKHGDETKAAKGAIKDARGGLIGNGTDTGGADDHDFFVLNVTELVKRLLLLAQSYYSGGSSVWFGYNGGSECGTRTRGYKVPFDTDTKLTATFNEKGYSTATYEKELKIYTGVDDVTDEMREYLGKTSASASSGNTSQTNTVDPGSDLANKNLAKYYDNLWKYLSTYGWSTQSNETIQENLNKGLYSINGTKISESENFDPKKDQDTIDEAKRWYDRELKKIEHKEKDMDTKLTKYQTEYSALTKDYDSVKSIIDANVQKSFTYCQNG